MQAYIADDEHLLFMSASIMRCWNTRDDLYIKYHDEEWGVPLHDDTRFFEFLVLGGFQAGLTWGLILKRREAFRKAFDNFCPERVVAYTSRELESLMANPEIIRNKMKILATINNAKRFLEVQEEFGSFDAFIWRFVQRRPIRNKFVSLKDLPTETVESKSMSEELKRRGFQFVGPKICYAFMQATGLVNDHLIGCFRHEEIMQKQHIV